MLFFKINKIIYQERVRIWAKNITNVDLNSPIELQNHSVDVYMINNISSKDNVRNFLYVRNLYRRLPHVFNCKFLKFLQISKILKLIYEDFEDNLSPSLPSVLSAKDDEEERQEDADS